LLWNSEHFGDLRDGVLAVSVQPLGHRHLIRRQFRLTARYLASGSGRRSL